MKNIGHNYLSVMKNIVTDNAKIMTENLEKALVNAMNSLNVGMISFALNGDNSNFDVPRAFAVMEDDVYVTGNEYIVKEIIAVLVKNNRIYIVPDTLHVPSNLLDELECWTHFTPRDVAKLKDLQRIEVTIKASDNYNLINRNDLMFNIFKSCIEALKPIKEPLVKAINVL